MNEQQNYEDRDSYEISMILTGQGLDIEDCPNCNNKRCTCEQGDEQ